MSDKSFVFLLNEITREDDPMPGIGVAGRVSNTTESQTVRLEAATEAGNNNPFLVQDSVYTNLDTAEHYRKKMQELGYLPSPELYTIKCSTLKRIQKVKNILMHLQETCVPETRSSLISLRKKEELFAKEGHPSTWGTVSHRLFTLQQVKDEMMYNVTLVDHVISKLRTYSKEQRTALREIRRRRYRSKGLGKKENNTLSRSHQVDFTTPVPSFANFPSEIMQLIFIYLANPKYISALATTCKNFHFYSTDTVMWKSVLRNYLHERIPKDHTWEQYVTSTPLFTIFGKYDTTIYREIYFRLWFHRETSRCGLCRVGGQKYPDHILGVEDGWIYKLEGRKSTETHFYDEPLTKDWHEIMIEHACLPCQNLLLLPESKITECGLIFGNSLKTLYYQPPTQNKILARVFLEDAYAYAKTIFVEKQLADSMEETNPSESVDLSSIDTTFSLLRHIPIVSIEDVETDIHNMPLGDGASNYHRFRNLTWWDILPDVWPASKQNINNSKRVSQKKTNVPSHRRVRWKPQNGFIVHQDNHGNGNDTGTKRKHEEISSSDSEKNNSPKQQDKIKKKQKRKRPKKKQKRKKK